MINQNKSKSRWISRKLFTYRFKGRQPRGLLWRKAVYEEWFLYAREYQSRGGMIPRAFGKLSKFLTFEDWWRHPEYGFELFCEPFIENYVQEVSSARGLSDSEILLKVNLKGDRDMIQRDMKLLLDKLTEDYEYQSAARFQPSTPMKRIQIERIKNSRLVWEITKEGKTQAEIVSILGLPEADLDQQESSIRRVQRYKAAYKKSCEQISKGTFP
jgi:hypothetical protein